MDEGWIAFYPDSDGFLAYCAKHSDPEKGLFCTRWRTAEIGDRPAIGRPCGHLVTWLHYSHIFKVKSAHMKRKAFPHPERSAGRERLKKKAGGQRLLRRERRLNPPEPEEPWPLRENAGSGGGTEEEEVVSGYQESPRQKSKRKPLRRSTDKKGTKKKKKKKLRPELMHQRRVPLLGRVQQRRPPAVQRLPPRIQIERAAGARRRSAGYALRQLGGANEDVLQVGRVAAAQRVLELEEEGGRGHW